MSGHKIIKGLEQAVAHARGENDDVRITQYPSASAPDGLIAQLRYCAGTEALAMQMRIACEKAANLLSTRPPAIDGQAWPSEEQIELGAKALHMCDPNENYLPWDELPLEFRARYRRDAQAVLAAAPPAQGSAGWPSEYEMRLAVRRALDADTHLSDPVEIAVQAIRALAPPVEVQGSERMREALGDARNYIVNHTDIVNCGPVLKKIDAALGDSSPASYGDEYLPDTHGR